MPQNNELIDMFFADFDENVNRLDEKLLEAEQNPKDEDIIKVIMRAAHSIKGASGIMGFNKIKELTHAMESVMDDVRKGQIQMDKHVVDIMFRALDTLRLLKEEIINETGSLSIENNLSELKGLLGQETNPEPAKLEPEILNLYSNPENLTDEAIFKQISAKDKAEINSLSSGENSALDLIFIRFSNNETMRSVKTLIIQNMLKSFGKVIRFLPDEKVIDAFTSEIYVVFLYVSQKPIDPIIDSLRSMKEVAGVLKRRADISILNTKPPKEVQAVPSSQQSEPETQAVSYNKSQKPDGVSLKNPDPKPSVQMIKVDITRLERMMESVEHLMIAQSQLISINKRLKRRFKREKAFDESSRAIENISLVISNLQDDIIRARMMPINYISSKFPRLIRDVANQLNKEVCLLIEGNDVKLDRTILEEINDPLIHILRNSVDHGIELPGDRLKLGKSREGVIKITISEKENQITITIEDDGKGMDSAAILESALRKGVVAQEEAEKLTHSEIINLIFRSGFSTAQKVSDISGRGVGMDIVKTNIEKINGSIDIETQKNKGTKMIVKIPSTTTIVPSLIVEVNNKVLCLPLSNVEQVLELSPEDIKSNDSKEVLVIRGCAIPLVRLHRLFGGFPKQHEYNKIYTAILSTVGRKVAVQVDDFLGSQNIIKKPLSNYIGRIPYVSGVTLVGSGEIAMLLDIAEIAEQSISIQ